MYQVDGPRGYQEPRIHWAPEAYSYESAVEAIELGQTAHVFLDPWQELYLHDTLGETRTGKWQVFESGLCVGRQNGKTKDLLLIELASLYLFDEKLCIHSAHRADTSFEAFNAILEIIEGCPDLDKKVRRVIRNHGEEGIEVFRDHRLRRLRFRTRSDAGGRGFSGDRIVFDEAMFLAAAAMGALVPTMSVMPNPQMLFAGSAGFKHSTKLGSMRQRAIQGGDDDLTYHEYSIDPCNDFCPKDCEEHDSQGFREQDFKDDPVGRQHQMDRLVESYRRANPTLGIRLSLSYCEKERKSLKQEEFVRERLGVGDWPVEGESWTVISQEAWGRCCDATSATKGQLVFAIDVTPDKSYACIGLAGLADTGDTKRTHVEVSGQRGVLDHKPGDGWVVARAKELWDKHKPLAFVVDTVGYAGALIPELEAQGITVISPTAREYAQGCGAFVAACMPPRGEKPRLVHIDQVPLSVALSGVGTRPLAEMLAWSKQNSATDISPLVSVTLAMWGLGKLGIVKPKREAWALWD